MSKSSHISVPSESANSFPTGSLRLSWDRLLCTTFSCFLQRIDVFMGSIPHYPQTQPAGAIPASQACATGSAGTMMFRAEVSCPAATQAWEACLENDHNKRVENDPISCLHGCLIARFQDHIQQAFNAFQAFPLHLENSPETIRKFGSSCDKLRLMRKPSHLEALC